MNKKAHKTQKQRRYLFENEYKKQRILAFERDKYICQLCGKMAVECHHIVYRSKGGTNDLDNLISLCFNCHKLVHSDKKYQPLLIKIIKENKND